MSKTSFIHFDYHQLCKKVSFRLQQAGLSVVCADIEAEIMVEADLLAVPSHGVRMLANLLTALENQKVVANTPITIIREFGAVSVVDYANGTGRYAAQDAMNRAVKQAKDFGVGVCLAKNTSHWGRGHAYASRAAQQGFVGLCTTNAIPSMASWGAKKAVIGNNPLAIGVPSIDAKQPIVLDMAMSQVAVGKIATMLREDEQTSDALGLGDEGNPTTDLAEILQGSVLPMGGHKGEGLALMMELLTAALAGAAFSYQLIGKEQNGVDAKATKMFIALHIDAFIESNHFKQHIAELFQHLKSTTPNFRFPGQRGWLAKEKNLKDGVPVHVDIVQELAQVGLYL